MAQHLKFLIMLSIGAGGTAASILLLWKCLTPEQFRRWIDRVGMLIVVVTWGAGYLAVAHPRLFLAALPWVATWFVWWMIGGMRAVYTMMLVFGFLCLFAANPAVFLFGLGLLVVGGVIRLLVA